MLELRASGNDIVEPYAEKYGVQFFPDRRPWEQKVDIALPCATQNELDEDDARRLIDNGVLCVGEISNMGCRPEAIDLFIKNRIMYGRRCGYVGIGNDAERHAYQLECRGGRPAFARHYARYPYAMRKIWY